jgi:hypothetical protein
VVLEKSRGFWRVNLGSGVRNAEFVGRRWFGSVSCHCVSIPPWIFLAKK